MNNPVLSMLGLALRGGRLAVGEEPVEAVVRARDARVLLVASDAADNTYRRVKHFAEIGQCIWLRIPYTKAELGQAVGRNATAIVAVTDVGLAAAIVHRLADTDPERYAEAAERLDLKAKRAAERQAEQRAHEKNVRTGKYKAKKPAPEPEKADPPQKERIRSDAPSGDSHGKRPGYSKSRPSKENRPKPRAKANPYAHSRPVKKGKGSFRKKEG